MTKLEIVKHYKTLLLCDQFLLTGSTALAYHGLGKLSKASNTSNVDIDIILVNPTDESKDILTRLQENYPAKSHPISGGEVKFIFLHEGVKVDVFFENIKINNVVNIEGVDLNPIYRIVDAKKKANRPKDWVQLMQLSHNIVTPKEFISFTDNF